MAKKPKDDDAARRIAALEMALRPFVEHGTRLRISDKRASATKPVYDIGRHVLTMGDFDAAMAAVGNWEND